MEQTIQKKPRLEVVDALRGFALLAILLVHNVEHYIFSVYPTESPAWLDALCYGCGYVQKLAFTFVLLSSFVLLYRRDGIRSRIARLSTYGQGPLERLWHKWTWM